MNRSLFELPEIKDITHHLSDLVLIWLPRLEIASLNWPQVRPMLYTEAYHLED